MNGALKRDVVAGALAGLVAGTISGWAILAQGLTATAASFIGVAPSGGGFAVHLAVSAFIGGSFGAVFRYSPYGSAASLTGGILYGLLWRGQGHPHPLTLWNVLPAIFLAFTLSIYDVVQKSLPALILMACGGAYVVYRLNRPTATLSEEQSGEGLGRHAAQPWLRG